MAARKSPSKGGKPDKLIRDALILALKREDKDENGRKTTKLNRLITKLVKTAIDGADGPSIAAIREISDRVDGKPTQPLEHTDPVGGNPFTPLLELIAANGRPRPGG